MNKKYKNSFELVYKNLILFDFPFIQSPEDFSCKTWLQLYRSIFISEFRKIILRNVIPQREGFCLQIPVNLKYFRFDMVGLKLSFTDENPKLNKFRSFSCDNRKVIEEVSKILNLQEFLITEQFTKTNEYQIIRYNYRMFDKTLKMVLDIFRDHNINILKSNFSDFDIQFNILKNICKLFNRLESSSSISSLIEERKFIINFEFCELSFRI